MASSRWLMMASSRQLVLDDLWWLLVAEGMLGHWPGPGAAGGRGKGWVLGRTWAGSGGR